MSASSSQQVTAFKVLEVPLDGKNLIEASAGTGKTYSIALLTIRLLLEKKIPVTEMLMVTFTNAAVAELAGRIRTFINDTRQYLEGFSINDPSIQYIADNAVTMHGHEAVLQLAKDANLLLDEMNIQTIHSFCQQTLNEFALESRQVFGAELIPSQADIIENYYNDFWRRYITTLPVATLGLIDIAGFREQSLDIIRQSFEGKQFINVLSGTQVEELYELLKDPAALESYITARKNSIRSQFSAYLQENTATVNAKAKSDKVPLHTKFTKALEESTGSFWDFLHTRKPREIVQILTAILPEALQPSIQTYLHTDACNFVLHVLYNYALQYVTDKVRAFQKRSNYLTYNDLIHQLYIAVCENRNQQLILALQRKYKAVFVDEFQDTDKEQFDIFRTAFAQQTAIFLIGDPKQSIYAFRKADVFTYFKARHFADRYYTMDTNYRSAENFIESMNDFFLPFPGFDTFSFADEQDEIRYFPVQSPVPNTQGRFLHRDAPQPGIMIAAPQPAGDIPGAVATDILHLVNNKDYCIEKDGEQRPVRYSDIGILVRKKEEARNIRAALRQRNIPAIVQNESRLFDAPAVGHICTLLEAILHQEMYRIRTVAASPLMQYTFSEMMQLDELALLQVFQELLQLWKHSGISACLLHATDVLGIKQNLLYRHPEMAGDYAIITQLIEVLHNLSYYRQLNPEEIILWLKNGIAGNIPEEDTFILRLESDEAAVQIVTIHSSKGLEYNIVFAPYLGMNDQYMPMLPTQTYRGTDSRYYLNTTRFLTEQEKELAETQIRQENRRMLYVAVTRAVYHCYIYVRETSRSSALTPFLTALEEHPSPHIRHGDTLLVAASTDRDHPVIPATVPVQLQRYPPAVSLKDDNWSLLSYSKIAGHGEGLKYERIYDHDNAYATFIFQMLRSGADTGSFLHLVLEKIDFTHPLSWESKIERLVHDYYTRPSADLIPMLVVMAEHIVHAIIHTGAVSFSMSGIEATSRINELEFFFPLQDTALPELETALSRHYEIHIRDLGSSTLEGMMNGFIDMVFRHEGKYYILDWKSNYLGYLPEHYNRENLMAAMNVNNYHLQYLLYTLALHKYLKTRLNDYSYEDHFGGVIYVFLRGVRKASDSGIFTHRPDFSVIEELARLLHTAV